jgi:hypothetical protein
MGKKKFFVYRSQELTLSVGPPLTMEEADWLEVGFNPATSHWPPDPDWTDDLDRNSPGAAEFIGIPDLAV